MPKIAGPIRQQAERSRGKLLDVSCTTGPPHQLLCGTVHSTNEHTFDHSDTDPHLIIPHSEVGDAAEVLATPMKAAGHVQDGCSLCGRNVVIGLRRSAKLHLRGQVCLQRASGFTPRALRAARAVLYSFSSATPPGVWSSSSAGTRTASSSSFADVHQSGTGEACHPPDAITCGDGALHPDCRALVLAVLGHHVHEKVSPRQVFLHAKLCHAPVISDQIR
eukprot:scaffold1642_cov252-Pinguiococcus_pyrenoidosus.AAC.11